MNPGQKIKVLTGICFLFLSMTVRAQITPWEASALMQKGINLGNTLEPPDEGGWNNPPAQEYYFDLYKEAGFQTVRIPVRWDEHTQKASPYLIDEAWMNRVEQIVDWGLSRGLFIVINAHHEEWIKSNYDNPGYRARFDSIWSQIAVRFKDKSDRLLFEIINEPYGLTKEQNDDLHQRVLSIIRKTNPTRIVIFQGHNWGGSDELLQAAIPNDNYIMGSFHSYDPYLFGLEGQGTWGSTGDITELRNKFIAVKNWSDEHNIPVFLGEFGAVKTCDYNSRMRHYRAYVLNSQAYGFVGCAWDDGGDFRIMERQSKAWNELKSILIHTSAHSPIIQDLKVVRDTLLELTWYNPVSDYDTIIIQRRTDYTTYVNIDTLSPDQTVCLDSLVNQNQYYYYRIIGHYNDSDDQYSQPVRNIVPEYVPAIRGYFNGTPDVIPGIVEAEDFDTGGEGLTYHDNDEKNIPGKYRPDEGVDIYFIDMDRYMIGYTRTGEWCEYTIDIQEEGEYTIKAIVSAEQDGASFRLKIGNQESDAISVPSTRILLDTTTVITKMILQKGEQIMRFSVLSEPEFLIDRFEFQLPAQDDSTDTNCPENVTPELLTYQNSAGELIIRMENNTGLNRIDIYSITGQKVFTCLPDSDSPVSVNNLQTGFYIVKAYSKGKLFTRKIVIH